MKWNDVVRMSKKSTGNDDHQEKGFARLERVSEKRLEWASLSRPEKLELLEEVVVDDG